MTTLIQALKPYASDAPERTPHSNIEIRWPGMKQDWQYIVETPGAGWREYGPLQRAGSYNPKGPTDPKYIIGFHPYPLSTRLRGELDSTGTPMTNQAPRPFTEVSPHPTLDLYGLRWNYHADSPDAESSSLSTGSTGSTLSKTVSSPPAWNPHFEHLQGPGQATAYQDAPPTMSQYSGTLVADHLTLEEFKLKAPTVNPGDKGTLIVHGPGFGLFAKAPLIRDYWADRFLTEGLVADRIYSAGLNDFAIQWTASPQGMRAGPIAIGIIIVSILLILGWLSPRLSLFLEKGVGGLATNLGLGVMLGAVALAVLARSSKRGIL